MADKETGLNIPVSAYADKNSAKEAVNELTKGVLSSLKDGYIEVPAEIKASYARGSKELEKAQKDVITQWEKMSKKGFSSSPEYLDELIEKYQKFKRLAGKEGKGNSKQTKWLSKTIGESLQPYLAQKRELDAIIKSFEDITKETKKTTSKKSTRKARNLGPHSNEEINANIKQHKDRQYKGVKSTGPKEPRTGWVDPGATNDYEAKMSEVSGYKSNMARQMRQSEKEARKENAKTLTVRIDKEEASKAFSEALSKRKYGLTDTQKAAGLSDAAIKQLPKLLEQIESGKSETAQEDFLNTVEAIFKLDSDAGRKLWNTIKKEINITLGKYFNTSGKIGGTDGTDKSAKSKLPEVEQALKGLLQSIEKVQDKVIQEFIDEESVTPTKKSKNNSTLDKVIKGISDTNKGLVANKVATEEQLGYDMIEHSAERVSDRKAGKADRTSIDKLEEDLRTGFNSDANANRLIDINTQIKSTLDSINETLAGLVTNGIPTRPIGKQPEISGLPSPLVYNAETKQFEQSSVQNKEVDYTDPKNQGLKIAQVVEFSESEIKTYSKGIKGILERVFEGLKPQSEADRIMSMNAKEQKRMYAQRLETYGMNRGRSMTDTGDIADVKRTKSLFGWIYKNDEKNKQLFQDIKLTPGFTGENAINTTAIMEKLNKVLSGPEMFKAQTGGTLRNIIGSMTGYIGMPSLEKSRAQAEGLNQVMANVRKEVLDLVQDIQRKESALSGMKELGTAKFTKDGQITSDSSLVAQNTFTKLEEQKGVLRAALAEVGAIDKVVDRCGGKVSRIIKQIGFVMPELLDQNTILQNINAGLDKNGKALKFQTRTAEMLNYAYQLMARHIGQMFKNWMIQLNPLTQIKKLFSDFSGYNTKWQRTMNVVKYNLRSIILPMMDKIAQLLVNMIGFADIILQKVQAAFGNTPISLFDQENAKKFKDEVEQISSISAGFDELHDIGTDEDKSADNLLGEIYKPQLSQEWIDLANEIGDLFAGIITGDLGFGEAMAKILGIAWEGIQLIGKEIWNAIKNSTIGQYIEKNWKNILATLLAIFVGWKLLKVAGSMLAKALFGGLSGSTFGTFLSSLGTKFTTWISSAFTGSALEGTMATAGTSLGQVFAVAFVSILAFVLGKALADWGAETLKSNTDYNQGLMDGGGDPDDKKSNVGGTVATIGGSALAGAGIGAAIGSVIPGVGTAIGAGIGALIGGIAGTVRAVLVPAFEEAEIAARNMNNEMQNIEYYEGKVQAAKTKVDELDELMQMSNDTIEAQKDKVYELGEKYGVSSEKMNELVRAIENGNYNTELAAGLNDELATALETLDYHYDNNTELTNKLADAKRKLAKEELELSIASDISAGNFELATARIEYAMAAGLYTTDEAAAKMTQIMKETSYTEGQELLSNVSPELQKKWDEYTDKVEQGKEDMATIFGKMSDEERKELLNSNNEDLKQKWFTYATTTQQGKEDLARMYAEMNEKEREAFSKDYSNEAGGAMGKAIDAMQREIDSASWDWSHPFKSLQSLFTGDWSWKAEYASYDVGTNYVPNDGFAYIHKGEAIIPKEDNVFAGQGKAWQGQELTNARVINAITSLENTMKQGINVNGQFVQRGSDLVAVVNKTKSQTGADLLSNVSYAR